MKGNTTLLELSKLNLQYVLQQIIRKGSMEQKGTIRSKLKLGLELFFSAHHLMKLCICTKLHEIHLMKISSTVFKL